MRSNICKEATNQKVLENQIGNIDTPCQKYLGVIRQACMQYCKIFYRPGGDNGWRPATRVPVVPPWTGGRPGSKEDAQNSNLSPLKTFELYLTEHLVEYIVDQTNLYMVQSQEIVEPVTKKEMKKFIGLTLLTGKQYLLITLSIINIEGQDSTQYTG